MIMIISPLSVLHTQEDMQCCSDDVVGSVVELHCDGLMSIKWADGCLSQCYPEQLLLVGNMVSWVVDHGTTNITYTIVRYQSFQYNINKPWL